MNLEICNVMYKLLKIKTCFRYRGGLTGPFNLTDSLNYVVTSGLLLYPEKHYEFYRFLSCFCFCFSSSLKVICLYNIRKINLVSVTIYNCRLNGQLM